MSQTLFAFPILSGRTEAARAFLQELEGPRKQELIACDQRVGIAKETWGIQQSPQGDLMIAYVTGENLARSFEEFAASQDPFDRWFKDRMQDLTGADLYAPPTGPVNEVLSDAVI